MGVTTQPMPPPIRGKVETYEEWRDYVTSKNRKGMYWKSAGDWFFPTIAANELFKGKMFHICEANWRLDNTNPKPRDKERRCPTAVTRACDECGAVIPDGIKMIAGLLSW